jgi:hypothetical protein
LIIIFMQSSKNSAMPCSGQNLSKQEKAWFKYQTFNSNPVGYLTHLATKLVLQNSSGDQNWGQ